MQTLRKLRRINKQVHSYVNSQPAGYYRRVMEFFLSHHQCLEFTKNSVAVGAGIGLFWCMIPMPGQSVMSSVFTFIFRGNIPISIAAVWVSNPLTMVPFTAFNYWLGVNFLRAIGERNYQFSLDTVYAIVDKLSQLDFLAMFTELKHILLPVLLGTVLGGLALAIIGVSAVYSIWYASLFKRKRSIERHRRNHQ